jgi:hypothetical protein
LKESKQETIAKIPRTIRHRTYSSSKQPEIGKTRELSIQLTLKLSRVGALQSHAFGAPWPDHYFPPWLNLYSLNDFVSFVGQGVFGDQVEDVRVPVQGLFSDSHSNYWAIEIKKARPLSLFLSVEFGLPQTTIGCEQPIHYE